MQAEAASNVFIWKLCTRAYKKYWIKQFKVNSAHGSEHYDDSVDWPVTKTAFADMH